MANQDYIILIAFCAIMQLPIGALRTYTNQNDLKTGHKEYISHSITYTSDLTFANQDDVIDLKAKDYDNQEMKQWDKRQVVQTIASSKRVKRQIVSDIRGLTDEQKNESLAIHNKLRRLEPASDMEYIIWNDYLTDMVQEWLEGCIWGHGQPARDPETMPFNPVGQNLYFTTASTINITHGNMLFYNEKKDYDYNTTKCSAEMCGHYTQLTWAKSREIGCGLYRCPVLTDMKNPNKTYKNALFYGCNYGPAGNYKYTKPYQKGPACTQCHSGQYWCDREQPRGLCRRDCSEVSDTCECAGNGVCQNGGILTCQCSCACQAGFLSDDCSDICKDKHSSCGRSPGWPKYMCRDETWGNAIKQYCPKMCEVCGAPLATNLTDCYLSPTTAPPTITSVKEDMSTESTVPPTTTDDIPQSSTSATTENSEDEMMTSKTSTSTITTETLRTTMPSSPIIISTAPAIELTSKEDTSTSADSLYTSESDNLLLTTVESLPIELSSAHLEGSTVSSFIGDDITQPQTPKSYNPSTTNLQPIINDTTEENNTPKEGVPEGTPLVPATEVAPPEVAEGLLGGGMWTIALIVVAVDAVLLFFVGLLVVCIRRRKMEKKRQAQEELNDKMERFTTVSQSSSTHLESYQPVILSNEPSTFSTFVPSSEEAHEGGIHLDFSHPTESNTDSVSISSSVAPTKGILKKSQNTDIQNQWKNSDNKSNTGTLKKDKGSIRGKISSEDFDDLKKIDERKSLFGSNLLY